jgi:hypothetical protein
MGRKLLEKLGINLENLSHSNFKYARQVFDDSKEQLYSEAEGQMVHILEDYFHNNKLDEIDGRTMAAAFRRFDIMLKYL